MTPARRPHAAPRPRAPRARGDVGGALAAFGLALAAALAPGVAPSARGQDGAGAAAEGARAPSTPAATPAVADEAAAAADAALERAARFQRGETARAAPRSLHGSFHVSVRAQDGSMIEADVERWYTVEPERMLTTRTESVTGSTSSVGWDGRRAWFRDQGTGKVVVYSDDPGTFEEDIAQLREQMRLTRLLLDACVLDALRPRLLGPQRVGTETVVDLDGVPHEVELVSARLEDRLFGAATDGAPPGADDPPPMLTLEFGIDRETGALWSLAVRTPHRPDVAPMHLRFDLFGRSADGLQVPGNIRVSREGEAREAMRLGVHLAESADGEERLRLDVDVTPDEALFAVPR